MAPNMTLHPRQFDANNPNPDNIPDDHVIDSDGRYDRTGYIVRWSIIAGVIFLACLFFLLSYLHAQRRLRKGLSPLRYHRWMVKKRGIARLPRHTGPQAHPVPDGTAPPAYGMQPMAPPPAYQPPEAGSKIDPSQGQSGAKWGYGSPAGQPPDGAV